MSFMPTNTTFSSSAGQQQWTTHTYCTGAGKHREMGGDLRLLRLPREQFGSTHVQSEVQIPQRPSSSFHLCSSPKELLPHQPQPYVT